MTDEEIVDAIASNNLIELQRKLNSCQDKQIVIKSTFKIQSTTNTSYIPFSNLTLFHIAAYYDAIECFILLVESLKIYMSEKDIFSIQSAQGYYALHYALFNKSTEVALYIVNRAKWQIGAMQEGAFYCPLALAVRGGIPEIVDELLKIDSGEITEKQIDQAFNMALSTRNYPCLKILILKHESNKQSRGTNETIPMKAAKTLSPDAVSLVLEHEDINLDKIYYNKINGRSESDCLLSRLLLCKSKTPHLFKKQIIDLLHKLDGKEIEPSKNQLVKGPCHWMCYFCDVEIAQMIIDHFIIDINRLDGENQTGPFEMARDTLDEDDIIKMLDFLIAHDFDINQYKLDKNGKLVQKTLLEKFASFPTNKLKVIRHLLLKNADPDAPSYIQQGKYGTIRNYVKKRRDTDMNDLFDEFPPKTINNL